MGHIQESLSNTNYQSNKPLKDVVISLDFMSFFFYTSMTMPA